MINCPACHTKVEPLHMERGDTLRLFSRDGYLLREDRCEKGRIAQVTCPNCSYVIREYRPTRF